MPIFIPVFNKNESVRTKLVPYEETIGLQCIGMLQNMYSFTNEKKEANERYHKEYYLQQIRTLLVSADSDSIDLTECFREVYQELQQKAENK